MRVATPIFTLWLQPCKMLKMVYVIILQAARLEALRWETWIENLFLDYVHHKIHLIKGSEINHKGSEDRYSLAKVWMFEVYKMYI